MKKIIFLAGFTLVATIIVLVMTLGDYLALHDIRQDYVSKEILDSLGVNLSDELPAWTATAGEWAMVQFSYVARFGFLVLNVITLSIFIVVLRKRDKERGGPASAS